MLLYNISSISFNIHPVNSPLLPRIFAVIAELYTINSIYFFTVTSSCVYTYFLQSQRQDNEQKIKLKNYIH